MPRPSKSEAMESLKGQLNPGDTLFCVVRALRAEGERVVTVHTIHVNPETGRPDMAYNLSYNVAALLGWPWSKQHMGVVVEEVGTLAQGLIVMRLSMALFGDVFSLKCETL
jgi:hypothetical protein